MNKKMSLVIFAIGIIIMSSCGSPNTANPAATNTPTKISPTATITPTSSPTPIPLPPVISASNVMNLQEDFRIGQGAVSDAVWLPDGNVALVYSTGVSIYNPDTGDLIKSAEPENKAIGFSLMSPDGKHVATFMYNGKKVLIWDSNTGKIEYELKTKCQAQMLVNNQTITFNSDGSQLAICDEEGVSLWDLSNGEKIRTLKIERKDYLAIAFNPKNNTLATSGTANDFTDIIIWDLASGEVIEKLPQMNAKAALNLRFNHQGNILAWRGLRGSPGSVALYDINTNQRILTISNYTDDYDVFEFSPDDKTITIGGAYGWGTRLLDIATGELITEPNNNTAYLIKYSPDGSRFVAGWQDFSVYKNAGGAEFKRLGSFMTYSQIAFDSKGKYIAAGGNFTALWDLQTHKQAFEHIFAYGGNFLFTPNGDGLITNAWNNDNWLASIQQWDLRTENQQNFEGSTGTYLNSIPLFSPSGDLLAMGELDAYFNGTTYIRFWDANSKKFLFDIEHSSSLTDYKFSPDGKIFASAGGKTIYFWDINTQKTLKRFDCPTNIYGIAFSPDGTWIAAAADNGVYVWDTDSGNLISEFKEINRTMQVAFSPQGNILASTGYDKELHKVLFVWDISNNKILYKITGDKDNNVNHWRKVAADHAGLLFSLGGSLIVTSGLKREGLPDNHLLFIGDPLEQLSEYIQFWDASSGQLIKTLEYTVGLNFFSPYRTRFGFSPDGRLFAIADGTVHILHIAASSDNQKEDALPTSIPIPTSPPRLTNTPAPTASIENTFPNLSVVKTDSFDDPNDPEWWFDASVAEIKNGVLQIVGKNWRGGDYAEDLNKGFGIIVNFKYTKDSKFEMYFYNGDWDTDSYKRFGVQISNNDVMQSIWQGKTQTPQQSIVGSLSLNPGTWYSLLLIIRKNNEFFAHIWNPENPAQAIEYKNTFTADWRDLPWTFHIQAYNGTILFDDFKEMQTK